MALPDTLPDTLDEMHCFAIYAAWHEMNRSYSPMLRPFGLTYPQYITLTALWETDDVSVGALTAKLGVETNTLTPLLKRLETQGHVTRHRSTTDERKVFVRLTDQGRALQAHARHITGCLVQASGMPMDDLQALISKLQQLRHNLTQATDPATP